MPYLTTRKKPKAKTKPWFSRLLRHPARKRSGSILVHYTHPGPTQELLRSELKMKLLEVEGACATKSHSWRRHWIEWNDWIEWTIIFCSHFQVLYSPSFWNTLHLMIAYPSSLIMSVYTVASQGGGEGGVPPRVTPSRGVTPEGKTRSDR